MTKRQARTGRQQGSAIRRTGRPHELSPNGSRKDEYYEIKRLWDDDRGVSYISKQTGVSRQAIYNLIDREGWTKGGDSK